MQNIHGEVKRVLRLTKQLTEIKIEPWGCKAATKNHKTTKKRLKLTAKTLKSQTKTGSQKVYSGCLILCRRESL